jgi:hypothetical protein
MPAKERGWLHDGEDPTPIDQPGQGDQCHPRRIVGTSGLHLALDVQRQLLSQE